MVLDLNHAIVHATTEGRFNEVTTRRYFAVVDGIVGGEGDGPLSPEPKRAGILAVSDDPVTLDRVLAHVMGFDPERIPMLREASRASSRQITAMVPGVEPDVRMSQGGSDWRSIHLGFRAAPGWRGRIERPGFVQPLVDLDPTAA
jgi:hypothetical protein